MRRGCHCPQISRRLFRNRPRLRSTTRLVSLSSDRQEDNLRPNGFRENSNLKLRHWPAGTVALIGLLMVLLTGVSRATGAAAINGGTDYRIVIGDRLDRLFVDLCFADVEVPATLIASQELANSIDDIVMRFAEGPARKLRLRDRSIGLPPNARGCVAYTVEIPAVPGASRRSGLYEHNGAIAVSLERILLLPGEVARWHKTILSFSKPPGVGVSAPGRRLSASVEEESFELLNRPSAWNGTIAFGQLTQNLIDAGGALIRLSIVGGTKPETATALQGWVSTSVAAVVTLYGRFPVTDLQALVFPLGPSSDLVPWGEVTRGGGDAVHLYVDRTRTRAELTDDWVLSHELSHLLHPYMKASDAWLSEGIASYFQNVLRARAGLIAPVVAWQKLDAGFRRGIAQFSGTRTLARDTRAMMHQRHYMRVYWSGAAIALIADVDLRRRSGGSVSLDTVFEQLSRCCLPSRRRWGARELMAKMDEIAGYRTFVPLYERYAMRPLFPDLEESYRHLGLEVNARALKFSDDVAPRSLRADIMRGR